MGLQNENSLLIPYLSIFHYSLDFVSEYSFQNANDI